MFLFKFFYSLLLISITTIAFSQNSDVYIDNIVIKGNNSLRKEQLLEVLKITEQKKYSTKFIKESIDRLEEFYHKTGYSICEVSGNIDLDNNLIIEVKEGIIQEVFFQNLSYLEAYLFRQDFGKYENLVFYKPLIEEKIKAVGLFKKYNKYEYSFVPVENRPNYYILYLSLRTESDKKESDSNELETKISYFSSFRGWLLSLVPYFWIDIYNFGGIDHSLRLRVDWRFSTLLWKDFIFKESIESQDYAVTYYSPPIYKQLRLNFFTGAYISYHNADPYGWAGFDKTHYPIELGVGFDFGYFYTSMRTGFLFETIHRLRYSDINAVMTNYPELSSAQTRRYQTISLNLTRFEDKKFEKERDDKIVIELKYTFNNEYNWFRGELNTQNYIFYQENIFVVRYRAFYMFGKYPIYSLYGFADEFHMRGYGGVDSNLKFISLVTNRGTDLTLESWVSVYKDRWYQIFFTDMGFFDDKYFNVDISTGQFGFTYGIGAAFNFYELHFRILYGLPFLQRADKGTISWFLRRRF